MRVLGLGCWVLGVALLFPQHPAFRLLEWNVSDSAWAQRPEATRTLLRNADPDILVLVQVAPGMDSTSIRALLTGLRGPADTTWFLGINTNGAGAEHTVIASRDSVVSLGDFRAAQLPDTGALARLAAVPDTETGRTVAPAAINLRTNGALVRSHGRWILVAAVHLTCCGTAGSWREYRRQLAAITIRDLVRQDAAARRPAGVVIAGDFNVVSGDAPLDTLLGTLSPPLGPMRRATAIGPDGTSDWTWEGRGTPFPNGRLDHVLYSSGSLAVMRAKVLQDSDINRHRPVVVDMEITR